MPADRSRFYHETGTPASLAVQVGVPIASEEREGRKRRQGPKEKTAGPSLSRDWWADGGISLAAVGSRHSQTRREPVEQNGPRQTVPQQQLLPSGACPCRQRALSRDDR